MDQSVEQFATILYRIDRQSSFAVSISLDEHLVVDEFQGLETDRLT
jgi:hypothetical protein